MKKEQITFDTPYEAWLWIRDYCDNHSTYKVKWVSPLSVNIFKQIRAILSPKVISSRTLFEALKFHTHSIKYLKTIRTGALRKNLWGKVDGEVTAEQSRYALEQLHKHHASYMAEVRRTKRNRSNKNKNLVFKKRTPRNN
jgi:sRNA-binding protein